MSTLDPTTTLRQLTEHRHYPYRGCAPDPDDPTLAARLLIKKGFTLIGESDLRS